MFQCKEMGILMGSSPVPCTLPEVVDFALHKLDEEGSALDHRQHSRRSQT